MKLSLSLAVMLLMTGCTIRYTEADLARQHGFKLSERRPQNEKRRDERCYSRGQAIYCYLLGDTRDNFVIEH